VGTRAFWAFVGRENLLPLLAVKSQIVRPISLDIKKDKFYSIRCHGGPGEEYMYSFTLSLTSAIDGWVVNTMP